MYRNNGDGTFTQVANAAGLADATHGTVDNNGNGTFTEVTAAAGVNDNTNTWAAVWGDYDNDGYLDLFVVRPGTRALGVGNANILYHNNGDGTFTDRGTAEGVALQDDLKTSAHKLAAWGDYNNDGFLDLVGQDGIAPTKLTGESATGYHYLFKNNGNANHFLKVNLKGTTSNRAGIGARVTATYAGGQAFRENNGGGGGDYASQGSVPLHFGIGSAATATLQVAWPSGRVDTVSNVSANSTITVNESQVAMPPVITRQPRGATVRVGQTAIFKVTATGVPPLSYQWLKNNVPISGAIKASYKTPPVTTDDNGSLFAVIVSDANGSVRSADALLKVKTAL